MKTSDTLPYSSLTPYCLASLRILAIAFAIMFIPACAVPLGVNDAMIGIICSVCSASTTFCLLAFVINCLSLAHSLDRLELLHGTL